MKFICVILVVLFGAVLLMSCVPTSEAFAYSRFVPQVDSGFRITFEYPSSWVWTVDRNDTQTGSGLVTTINPDVMKKDTTPSTGGELGPNAFTGGIAVFVSSYELPDKAKEEMNKSIDDLLETNAVMKADVLSDQIYEIDGYYARQITTKVGPRFALGQDEPLIAEDIYILVESKYYVINLEIIESKRNSEFGKGFDHMIESIEFVP